MFGLLHNLFKYVKVSRERRITFVVLGLDAAGKTTLLNTLKGELGKEVAPTFGFKTEEMGEGKYTVVFFDLGGSSSMRKTWRSYLAEVHAVVFVVDAAAPARFAEAATTLSGLLENRQMKGKPLLVFANKQDLPTAASPADIAAALGLANHKQNKFHILACTALSSVDTDPDPRLRMGMRWLVASVDTLYGVLAPRVAADTAVVRAEEAKKKAERAERARVTREERQQAQRAEEAAAAAAAAGGSAACESAAAPPRPLPLDLTSDPAATTTTTTTTTTTVSNLLNNSPGSDPQGLLAIPAGVGQSSLSHAAGSGGSGGRAVRRLHELKVESKAAGNSADDPFGGASRSSWAPLGAAPSQTRLRAPNPREDSTIRKPPGRSGRRSRACQGSGPSSVAAPPVAVQRSVGWVMGAGSAAVAGSAVALVSAVRRSLRGSSPQGSLLWGGGSCCCCMAAFAPTQARWCPFRGGRPGTGRRRLPVRNDTPQVLRWRRAAGSETDAAGSVAVSPLTHGTCSGAQT
ncbi:MAG: hypothetical protein WDW38_005178 [Sanguina aurantia]